MKEKLAKNPKISNFLQFESQLAVKVSKLELLKI